MHARSARKKKNCCGKKSVFIFKEMLELVEEMEVEIAVKKACKQPRKRSVQEILKDEEDEILKNENNNSDFDCIVLRPRK